MDLATLVKILMEDSHKVAEKTTISMGAAELQMLMVLVLAAQVARIGAVAQETQEANSKEGMLHRCAVLEREAAEVAIMEAGREHQEVEVEAAVRHTRWQIREYLQSCRIQMEATGERDT